MAVNDKGNASYNRRSEHESAVAFSLLAGEMAFLLSDRQEVLRLRSARAFAHLQRLIAASEKAREEWNGAFKKGEVPCEKLGGAHLLLHGIYGFKARAPGGETDLVFGEPVDFGEASGISEGLVLTEWKIAATESEIAKKFDEAFEQALIYRATALSGVLLRDYRYLVVVTQKRIARATLDAARRVRDGITYVPVNIAVDPERASKEAPEQARATKQAKAKGTP